MGRMIDANNLNFQGRNYNKSQMKAILDFIDAQPTAYDVDKVVEKIESEAQRWKDSGKEYEDEKEIAIGEGLKKSIPIIKDGVIE